jgi:signal transduction histidine kinase
LNRLLRHNLRNKASVIGGNVELLLSKSDPDGAETERAAMEAKEAAEELRELSDVAMQINRVLDTRAASATTVNIVPILHNVVGRFRDRHSSASIETDIPEALSVVVTTGFRGAVDGLVENAIEHNPVSDPRVVVRI